MKCLTGLFGVSALELCLLRPTLPFRLQPATRRFSPHSLRPRPITSTTSRRHASILHASQVPLDNNNPPSAETAAAMADEDERAFLLLSNRKSLRQAEEEHRLRYEQRRRLAQQQQQRDENLSLTDSLIEKTHLSFKNVETMSENLFANRPLVALAIFVILGLTVAYLSGLVFLDGYISSLNPAQNGGVPYWNENVPTDEDSILLINSLHEIKDKLPSLRFW
eukprot:CAMPEP_0197467872 /NCGR_PEP_ID=MMETSP1175-20131217/65793_1 /TAXON_ID=1003142 /ORGANISM="Triceratium dubium, Strain CCMP147" /LENGTH=221 /DNA_ID=CAMNT_0043003961 /DNA_START=72 /DNA_END=734 /DNA_ORIENTATION=-